MWRLLSVMTAIISFSSVLFYWSKRKQLIEEDRYYLYGDSLLQELTDDIDESPSGRKLTIPPERLDESVDISNLIH